MAEQKSALVKVIVDAMAERRFPDALAIDLKVWNLLEDEAGAYADAIIAADDPVRKAAPDILAALKVLLDEAEGFNVSGVYFSEKCMGHKGPDLARAAIAKAEGG